MSGPAPVETPAARTARLRAEFRQLHALKLHLFPVGLDKKPLGKWKNGAVDYVETTATVDQGDRWAADSRAYGWANLNGNHAAAVFTLDVEVAGMDYPQISGAFDALPASCQRPSPKDGRHAVIRVVGEPVATERLAFRSGVLLAETRGVSPDADRAGAYAVITGPGRGPLPADFRPYELPRAVVDSLLDMIRSVDDGSGRSATVERKRGRKLGAAASNGVGTGGVIVRAVESGALSWVDVLDDGWLIVSEWGGRFGLLRPDYGQASTALESANAIGPVLVVHSAAVPWAVPGQGVNAATALTLSRFGGDYKVAMRAVEDAAAGGHMPAFMASWPETVLADIRQAVAENSREYKRQRAAAVVEVVEGTQGANPDRWLDKHDGLLVRSLALDITDGAPIMRDLSDTFWTYSGGVWTRDTKARVRAEVTARLGERTRRGHRTNVEEYLLGSVEIIEPANPQPDAINTRNGMLDWRTGRLREHDPDDKSTIQLGAAWVPGAACPVVEAWLREVLPADLLEPVGDSPGFIWEVLGYLCYSGNPLHKALLMLGAGRNGKGTFLRLITALLGPANVSAVPLHSLVDNRFRVAELEGRLANIAGDLDSTWLESTALFKAITGGDSVTAERKYGAPFDFSPFAVPVYSANAVWGTPDTSLGYMSRWVVLPFPNSFDGVEDRGLDEKLSAPAELEGVLAKAVQGLRAVLVAGNFTEPPSVAEAFGRFRDESDPVSAFMRETTEIEGGWFIPRARIWDIYLAWVSDSGSKSKLARSKLYTRLVGAGWVATAQAGVRGFTGRRLVVEVVPDQYGPGHLEPVASAPTLGDSVGGFHGN